LELCVIGVCSGTVTVYEVLYTEILSACLALLFVTLFTSLFVAVV
jgi:hypothetical protein